MAKTKNTLFSNSDASLVRYRDKETFCEDAQGTVWCEEEFYSNYVAPILKFGEVYIVNFKADNPPLRQLIIRLPEGNNLLFDKEGSPTKRRSFFPNDYLVRDYYWHLLDKNPDYLAGKIRMFVSGKADQDVFKDIPYFNKIKLEEPLGRSKLVFSFQEQDGENFMEELFALGEYDLSQIKCALDTESECTIESDPDSHMEYFADGDSSLMSYFREGEARELSKKIYKALKPGMNVDTVDSDELKKVNTTIEKLFNDELSSFFYEYLNYYNSASYAKMGDDVRKNLKALKDDIGVEWDPEFNKLEIQVNDLFYLLQNNKGVETNFWAVLEKYLHKTDRFSGYDEARYEFFDDAYFDYASFEKDVLPILKKIYDKLSSPNFKDTLGVYNLIQKDTDNRGYFQNPTLKNSELYTIRYVNPDEGTITFSRIFSREPQTMTNQEFVDWMTNRKLNLESHDILLSLQQILSDEPRKNRLT